MEKKSFKFKTLNEGTSNFWSMKGLPLLIFDYYEDVYNRVYEITLDQLKNDGVDIEEFIDPTECPRWDSTFDKVWNESFDYCTLDEDEIEQLQQDVGEFNVKMQEDDEIDTYEYDIPDVEIKSGYYEAAQLYCNTHYLDEKTIEKVEQFFRGMQKKYNLTELSISYHSSNGETGYHKINEDKNTEGFWCVLNPDGTYAGEPCETENEARNLAYAKKGRQIYKLILCK